MSLILSDVSFAYSRGRESSVAAVRGISLALEPGKLVLVVGATGSGKSTLLRLAAGLLVPDAGHAQIDGERITTMTARGAVGLVFQDPESQLFADTVVDDIAFGPRNLGATPEAAARMAAEALEAVGLTAEEFGERSPFTLSGGEARRVAIAGVLAMKPTYLLTDEPTAGLDASGRRAVRELLLAQRERAGVAVVSHAPEEFLGDADDVVVLRDGALGWSGSAADAIADPSVFSACGLRAPGVLETQTLARERGLDSGELTLDPMVAAERLARAGGWV